MTRARVRTGAGRLAPIFADNAAEVRVGGLTYLEIKRRLGLITPREQGSVSEEQRVFVGAPGSNGHAGAGWAPASSAAPAWSDVPVQPYERRTLPADERELLKYRLDARTAQALVDEEQS